MSTTPGSSLIDVRYPRATPRPWEALDADGEPRVYPWVGWTDPDGQIQSIVETEDADPIDCDNVRLTAAAVNEYEALRGIAQYARHLHNCAATRTNGGLNAPGKCDCGLDDWLAKWKQASGE